MDRFDETVYRSETPLLPEWLVKAIDVKDCIIGDIRSGEEATLFNAVVSFVAARLSPDEYGRRETRATLVASTEALYKRLESECLDISADTKVEEKEEAKKEDKESTKIPKFLSALTLSHGVYKLDYKSGAVYVLYQNYGPLMTCGYYNHHLVIIVPGKTEKSKQKLIDFCDEALLESSASSGSDRFRVLSWNQEDQYWMISATKTKRPLNSIFLPTTVKKSLLRDLFRFLSVEGLEFYLKHGIPYKRSYMFFGRPGCGKTSMIQALAGFLGRDVYFLQPAHPLMTDDSLNKAIKLAGQKSVIVLEDIDALFDNKRKVKEDHCPLSFSGLLNALDGVGDPDGNIFILTTNHPERLDPALIRHGRVDLVVEFPSATKEQLRDMLKSFYPEASEDLAAKFAESVSAKFKEGGISMAAVQHHFITHMFSTVEEAVDAVAEMEGDH